MSDQSDRFEQAAAFFGAVLGQVSAQQWDQPTPCDDWDVRELVNHVLVEQLWVRPLLDGRTIAEVGSSLDGDHLGSDPLAAWDPAMADSVARFAEPDAMAGIVHLSYGDESVAVYCDQMTLDALIHGWDLAQAIGADDSLPPELVAWAYDSVQSVQQMLTDSGMFGTPVVVADDADDQTKLLALLGRQA